MKRVMLWVLCLLSVPTVAQENFKVYYQETENGYKILADNGEFSPVSVEIDFKIENLSSNIGDIKVIEVPAQTSKHYIADLTVVERSKAIKLGYSVRYNHGNHLQTNYDKDHQYHLPFKKGTTLMVTQGYDGSVSHKNEYALDFRMPIGTEIYAARDGVVVLVEQSFNRTCTDQDCAKYNNYILVYHSDGTFAEYTHIKKDGAIVQPGDQIKVGQHIGYSGNVGWSTGPHLHFIVFLQRFNDRETLPTKFLIGNGNEVTQLEEKKRYTRAY
ncbi:M23 family metallopeptidase [Aquimarina sp. 2201CG14-23]|uniref:M23 family metallopeptidase n=1 Tax=Aquimarina mycalae TaxID=3040073 RepID=UPI002477DA81|nr:M23 family metallopeptidase [Aquimarina sp. 2201CG14-23]MDH7444970.1 M23 family metallopeptidase [Aquimarina sp. 2201CG14-23]